MDSISTQYYGGIKIKGEKDIFMSEKKSLNSLIRNQPANETEYKIVARACVIREDRNGGTENFLIPNTSESGLFVVRFKALSQRPWRVFNRSLISEIEPGEAILKSNHSLLIKVRNIIFLDAMLFIRVAKSKIYKIQIDDGPFYLCLPDDQFRKIWKDLMKTN